jgi:hypothetical protein
VPKQPDQLVNAYAATVEAVRNRVVAYATAMWSASPSLRDADVNALVSRIVPAVQAGQLQVANLTNAYITQLAAMEGITARPVAVDRDAILGYRGVPAPDVYRRPAVTTYTKLATGQPFENAKAAGLARLTSILATDLQQARTRQAQKVYSGSGFEYTVRTLTGNENCALCVIASTQRYHKSELMPIHPGCDCGQRGMKAGSDPGQVIDPNLLEMTHQAIDSKLGGTDRGARDLGEGNPISDFLDLIVTNEHGELGPTLGWRDDHFTSAADLGL